MLFKTPRSIDTALFLQLVQHRKKALIVVVDLENATPEIMARGSSMTAEAGEGGQGIEEREGPLAIVKL